MVQWLRMQVLGMEVPGSNSGKLFFNIFCTHFLPAVTALLEYLDPVILHLLVFALSRHTVVCRAAQEAGAQPREYIDRKKENTIFAPP